MTRTKLFLPQLLVAAGIVFLGGCGRDPDLPQIYPVKGRITMDGKPLVDAGVMFIPYGPTLGSGSQALTDAQGNYELVTQMTNEYGAAEGEHEVLISKLRGEPGVAETNANETLPARYSNPRSLELRAVIKPEPNVFNFDLTTKKQ